MKITSQLLLLLLLLVGIPTLTWAQDQYDPAKALSSEELFLKKNGNKRIFTRAIQNYLILDTTPLLGGFHRYRYFPGDLIRFRLKSKSARFNEEIYSVSDSSFNYVLINNLAQRMEYPDIQIGDLKSVKTQLRIPWVTEGSFVLPLAGLVYIGADFFNKGIDGQRYTTDRRSLIVGGGLIATGLVCYKVSFSSIKINKHNRVRVLQTY
jgi:hypothetical protein